MLSCQFRGQRALYEGNGDKELMEAARLNHPYPEATLQAWMDAYANRMKAWDGTQIRTQSVSEFVLDLQRCGELRVWNQSLLWDAAIA